MKTVVRADMFISRPPEAVAAVVLDPDRMVAWTSDLECFEVVSGAPGEVGSTARLHYRQKGAPYTMTDVLVEAEPNRRYVSRVTGDALMAEVETTLRPHAGGTQVTVVWKGSGKVFPLSFLLPLMRNGIRRQAEVDLRKLKALVEGAWTGVEGASGETPVENGHEAPR
jgi:uncharacterized protein YndB with AHSA1/START domain